MNSDLVHINKVAREVFDLYDKDKNGTVDKHELKPLLEKISKHLGLPMPTDKEIESGLKQLDINNDGVLQFNEFLPFYQQVYDQLMSKA